MFNFRTVQTPWIDTVPFLLMKIQLSFCFLPAAENLMGSSRRKEIQPHVNDVTDNELVGQQARMLFVRY